MGNLTMIFRWRFFLNGYICVSFSKNTMIQLKSILSPDGIIGDSVIFKKGQILLKALKLIWRVWWWASKPWFEIFFIYYQVWIIAT